MSGEHGTDLAAQELDKAAEATPSTSGSEEQRFLQEASGWYLEWLGVNDHLLKGNAITPDRVLVVVFSESPDVERARLEEIGTLNERIYRGGHDPQIHGAVIATQNMRNIVRIRHGFANLNEAITVCCEELEDSDTFMVIPLAQRRILVHFAGAPLDSWGDEPPSLPIGNGAAEVTPDRIDQDIGIFHDEGLRYAKNPLAKMVWKGKQHPYEFLQDPERRIQSYLLLTLRHSYKHLNASVDEEVVTKGGRCDIRVEWDGKTVPTTRVSSMIELKVLTHTNGPTVNLEWALSGVLQANKYRGSNSLAAFACIFDGRKDQSDQMSSLDAEASKLNVRLRRYAMEAPVDPVKPPRKRKKAAAPSKASAKPKAAPRSSKAKPKASGKAAGSAPKRRGRPPKKVPGASST